ncbi:hypothetical protein [Lacisediminihabitans sp.]|uniref:hypothetical protein n=1 Tax=Lacisediminihabitans sp. TaxID=2787631 RepID=UPI00374D438B
MAIVTALVRPIARVWLASVSRASLDLSRPTGAPHVHADGPDADRILLVADGPSVGHGQLSHELGLAGHLARRLSALTGRGAEIDIIAEGNLTAAGCLSTLAGMDLSPFDALVLTIGANEALGLSSLGMWRRQLVDLLDHVENTAYGVHTFVIGVPSSTSRIHFPRMLARIVDRQVVLLNEATADVCAGRPSVTLLPFDPPLSAGGDRNSSKSFDGWASLIAPAMSEKLDIASERPREVRASAEVARQQAFDDLTVLGPESEGRINVVTALARNLFGTTGVAIVFRRGDEVWVKCSLGMDGSADARIAELYRLTSGEVGLAVIEDTATDPRTSHDASSGHDDIRFFAGFPITSPDGLSAGALCIVDSGPRTMSRREEGLLQALAGRVQEEL